MRNPKAKRTAAKHSPRKRQLYQPETKREVVALAAEVGPHAAARKFGIPPETVQVWWRIERAKTGTEIPKKRRYTDKFRIAAVELAATHGGAQAARLLKIPQATLENWVKRTHAGQLPTKRRQHSEEKRMQLIELAKQTSTKETARRLHVKASTAQTWVFMARSNLDSPPRSYTAEARQQAIALARQTSPRNAATKLGIKFATVKKWCSEAARADEGVPARPKAQFTQSQRTAATELAIAEGMAAALAKFARSGLKERTLRTWLKQAGVHKGRRKNLRADVGVEWISQDYPHYAQWKELAAAWLATVTRGLGHRLAGVRKLIQYFDKFGVPGEPALFLSRAFPAADFYKAMCPNSSHGASLNNAASEFLDWVLLSEFGMEDDSGQRVVSPAFRNPIQRRTYVGLPAHSQSVYSPLPYGYISELRKVIAGGPNFSNWTFASSAMGAPDGSIGQPATDWFEVSPAVIDESDPDCVHRVRLNADGRYVVEMWSPVRWVALLAKLILPLRTFQVCVLDSGESDSLIYHGLASGQKERWEQNSSQLHHLPKGRKLWSQGVFRRVSAREIAGAISSPDEYLTVLHINTNKTADSGLEGAAKGYEMPWIGDEEELSSNIFYWLEKLRNWQLKYNPIRRRTSWTELHAKHVSPKTDQQLATYPETCFLFRFAEAKEHDAKHLPVSRELLDTVWYFTLLELEKRIERRAQTVAEGQAVQLVNRATRRALFPMHSLRVSLITSLALDGKLSLVVLQKIVGHSRLLMTIYYVVGGVKRTLQELKEASQRMTANSGESIANFLAQATHDRLQREAVFNDLPSALLALPKHPGSRNPAGWMKLHHGACLVGGNTSPIESESKIGGCFNGGPNSGSASKPRHEPVPGGAYNCVRCRWFVTTPAYLEELAAHFNVLMYHYGESEKRWTECDAELKRLLAARMQAEEGGNPFFDQEALKVAERRVQTSISKLLGLASDLDATLRLVERCATAREGDGEVPGALIAVGAAKDVKVAVEPVNSQVLQLAVACQAIEVYPDLQPGTAVLRQSQVLDAALMREGHEPFLLNLPESAQLKSGNALMRSLARARRPEDESRGLREVTSLLDARTALAKYLNTDLSTLIKQSAGHLIKFEALAEVGNE